MSKLKIGYFGDGVWAHNALKMLLDDSSIEIMFICGRFKESDQVLKKMAENNETVFITEKNINTISFIEKIDKYNCDLLVSMSFDQIFKKEVINLCPHKLINCHAGKLPFYRGRNVLNWALINGEKEFGITVHYVDEGIDTGDIIVQKTFRIDQNDDYGDILKIAHVECANLLYDAVTKIKDDRIIPIKQKDIHPVGFYCGIRKNGDERIDWNQESEKIFNFIRGIAKPGPMARSQINDSEIKINRASLIDEAPTYIGIPGQIMGKNKDTFVVKTSDTVLEIIEFDCDVRVQIGDRLI